MIQQTNSSIKHNLWIFVIAILMDVLMIVMLVPAIYVSRYAYPWSDDFTYSYLVRNTFLESGSVFKALGTALFVDREYYLTWQGTYVSCFLMALQPAVWNIKAYHLTGVIMYGSLMLSYFLLFYGIGRKLLKVSKSGISILYILVFLVSIEGVEGKAEAFTWYNSAIHYTFGHALWIFFLSSVIFYVDRLKDNTHTSRRYISGIITGILALLAAGTNNITVFGGGMILVLLTLGISIYGVVNKTTRSQLLYYLKSLSPILILYVMGALINLLAPGNRSRLDMMGSKTGFIKTVVDSFMVSFQFCKKHCSLSMLMFLILVGILITYVITKEKVLDDLSFSFPLPGIILVLSLCVFAALYAPVCYTSGPDSSILRVNNCIYYHFVLFCVFDEGYILGWLYKKGYLKYHSVVEGLIAGLASLILIFSVIGSIKVDPSVYLTSAAIHNLKSQSASYYGWQMAENTRRLKEDGPDVLVMPMAVDPDCLYPHDAEDWISGTRLFYGKESVTYESEPYNFN